MIRNILLQKMTAVHIPIPSNIQKAHHHVNGIQYREVMHSIVSRKKISQNIDKMNSKNTEIQDFRF